MRKLLLISLFLIPLALRAETKVPPEKELKTMVRDTLLAFNKGVQEKNFSSFYKQELATLFRNQMSLEKFTTAFESFFEKKGYDLSDVAKSDPVFDETPKLDSNGVLALNGSYPTRPNKIAFKLKYLFEKSAWKIVGINVQVSPVIENTGKAPSEKEARALALDSLLAFNQSIQEKNFESFHQQIGTIWRNEITPEKLKQIFQPFIDKEVDLSPIKKVQPKFETRPAINADGMLELNGSYPTKPSKVVFKLKYVYELAEWKLVAINVNLTKNTEAAGKTDDDDE
jgi:hypothetical protein